MKIQETNDKNGEMIRAGDRVKIDSVIATSPEYGSVEWIDHYENMDLVYLTFINSKNRRETQPFNKSLLTKVKY